MAQLIAFDIAAHGENKRRFNELKRTDAPDMRGGMEYINTPRHANYVETHTFQHVLEEVRKQFAIEPLTEDSFDPLRLDSPSSLAE